jgi:DNA-binding protein YbaB
VAEVGQMMPREPKVEVKTVAEIIHYVDGRTEKYRTTEIDIKATATITYPVTTIKIQEGRYIRDELYDLDLEYLEKLVNEAKKEAINKAAKFVNKRDEIYALFEKLGVKVEFERVEKDGDC